jgi:transcriptional regulator with XRE-family HTH domain
MSTLTAYGKFIRKIRIDKNINQKEHAELLNLSPTHLSNIEKGKKPINMDIINQTIEVLSLNADEEKAMIKAISESAPLSIKIIPKNENESLLALLFAQSLLNDDFDREKLKNFLMAN